MTDEQFEKEMEKLEETQRSQPATGPAINIFLDELETANS